MLLLRGWIFVIVLYNFISGILSIYNPMVLDNIFPGSSELFGTTSTMFSRVLGSLSLSIAGVRLIFVFNPMSREAFYRVLWTFFIFESMFAIEAVLGKITVNTVAFGIVAGTVSVVLMMLYKTNGWLENDDYSNANRERSASKKSVKKFN